MHVKATLAAAALATLVAGAAYAQNSGAGMNDQSMAQPSDQAAAPSATQAGQPASASTDTGPVTSSPTPPDQAYTLKAGDPNVVSNGPVPDTAANRKMYGGPMSNAGRHTAPTGN